MGINTTNNWLYKPALGEAGSTNKESFDVGFNNVDARLAKEVWVGDPDYGTTIQTAVTAIGSTQARLHIPAGAYVFSDIYNIPDNIIITIEPNATITSPWIDKSITTIEKNVVNPQVTTSTAHGLAVGDSVYLTGILQADWTTRLNLVTVYVTAIVDTTNFRISRSSGTADWDPVQNPAATASTPALRIKGRLEAGLYQVFTSTSMVQLNNLEFIYPEWWGAKGDNSTDCTEALNTCCHCAELAFPRATVRVPSGNYRVSSTVTIKSPLLGSGIGVTKFWTSINDGTPTLYFKTKMNQHYGYDGYMNFYLGQFSVHGAAAYPTRNNTIGLKVEDMLFYRVEGMASQVYTGFYHTAAVHSEQAHIRWQSAYVDQGFYAYKLTGSTIEVDCKYFYVGGVELNDVGSLTIDGMIQGFMADSIYGLKINNTKGVTGNIHFETAAGRSNIDLITIGDTSTCYFIDLFLGNTSAYDTVANNGQITIDRAENIVIRGRVHAPVLSTANTKNLVVYNPIYGEGGGFRVPDSAARTVSVPHRIENYFINAYGRDSIRGYKAVAVNNATLAQETTKAFNGGGFRVTCTDATSDNYGQIELADSIVTLLKANGTNQLYISGWLYIPNTVNYAAKTIYPKIILKTYNGATWYTSTLNYYGYSSNVNWYVDYWHHIRGVCDIPSNATNIYVYIYANDSAVNASSSDYVVASGLVVSRLPMSENVAGTPDFVTSALAGIEIGGKLTVPGTAAPSGADQTWQVGDKIVNTNQVIGAPDGWVCRVSGAPGTWSTLPGLEYRDSADHSSSGTGEDTLATATIPANTMGASGSLVVSGGGTITGVAGNKTIKLYFGATSWSICAAAGDAGDWQFEAVVTNTATNAQRINLRAWRNGALVYSGYETTAVDTTGDVEVKVTGECADGGDTITQTLFSLRGI